MSARLYVEGGGDGKDLRTACRKGFRTFFEKAGLEGGMPRIVACGSRNDALDDFRTALQQAGDAVLLVDSEGPVEVDDPWEHLRTRDRWGRPAGATDDQCHLMVQIMESWFLADRTTLADYYGNGFRANAIPGNPNAVEGIPKDDVLNGLRQATRATQKGDYSKGRHSFEILERLDPNAVRASSSWADRLLNTLGARP